MTLQLNGQRLCQQNIILLNLFPMKGSCKPPQEDSGKYFPDESFLQFTVGIPLLCTPFRQGLAPTTEQFCCTVGNGTAQRCFWGRWLPTTKCRNYREEEM